MILLLLSAVVGVWSAVSYYLQVFHLLRGDGAPHPNLSDR